MSSKPSMVFSMLLGAGVAQAAAVDIPLSDVLKVSSEEQLVAPPVAPTARFQLIGVAVTDISKVRVTYYTNGVYTTGACAPTEAVYTFATDNTSAPLILSAEKNYQAYLDSRSTYWAYTHST